MKRPVVWGFGLLCFCFLLRCFLFDKQIQQEQYPLDSLFEQSADAVITGQIQQIEQKPKSIYFYLTHVSVVLSSQKEDKYSFQNIVIISNHLTSSSYAIGNVIQVQGEIHKLLFAANPGQFDERIYYRQKNIYYKVFEKSSTCVNASVHPLKNALFSLQSKLRFVYQKCLTKEDAGIVSAMILGDKSLLSMEAKELYQRNGIGHILAISGLHISVICLFFYQILLFLRIPHPLPFGITVITLYGYSTMTGFSISTNRAFIMTLFLLFAKEIGKSYDALTAMAFSAIVTLLQKPYAIFSAGFLLSYGAVLGIVLVVPVCRSIFYGTISEQDEYYRKKHRKKREITANLSHALKNVLARKIILKGYDLIHKAIDYIISTLICSISISLITFPILLFFYYEIPTYVIFINLVILPLLSVLVIVSIVGGVVGLLCLPMAKIILSLSHMILYLYDRVCHLFQKLPAPVQVFGKPDFLLILLYYIILLFMIWRLTQKLYEASSLLPVEKRRSVALLGILLAFLCLYRGKQSFSCTMLDVGQGNGIIIQTKKHKTILIDGGSSDVSEVGKYRLLPYLKYYGIRTIDYMIMTHSDSDHISGQLELMEYAKEGQLTIKTYLLPKPAKKLQDENYQKVKNTIHKTGIHMRYIEKGDALTFDDCSLLCLHPPNHFLADSTNAYSTTLSLKYRSFSMLLTGDLEKNGEEAVLSVLQSKASLPENYDILQVAHHGSKNASSETFLEAVAPKYAWISCGYQNRYGHPHKELLSRLHQINTKVAITMQTGAIRIEGKNNNVYFFHSQN